MKTLNVELTPAPSELRGSLITEKEIATHRRVYCPHYQRCLDECTRLGWQSFTCTRCPLKDFAPTRPATSPYAQQRRVVEQG